MSLEGTSDHKDLFEEVPKVTCSVESISSSTSGISLFIISSY